jgi:hypothetical protein
VVDEAVGGAGTVHGDQQVAAVEDRYLSDGLLEDLDVVGRGVGAGAACAQLQRQRFAGVVAPGHQRMVAPGACGCPHQRLKLFITFVQQN